MCYRMQKYTMNLKVLLQKCYFIVTFLLQTPRSAGKSGENKGRRVRENKGEQNGCGLA